MLVNFPYNNHIESSWTVQGGKEEKFKCYYLDFTKIYKCLIVANYQLPELCKKTMQASVWRCYLEFLETCSVWR
jgi:hypothetical protein